MLYETLKRPQIAPFGISSKTNFRGGEREEGADPDPLPLKKYGVHTIKPQLRP